MDNQRMDQFIANPTIPKQGISTYINERKWYKIW